MFPLQKRKVGGYTFGQPTFYGTKHTGTDYEANYVEYRAPFEGIATKGFGPEGGNWWQLIRPNGDKLIARHLSKINKTGQVKEGDLVAVTGNTGSLTTKAHLHQETYINGKLSDPEKYNWNPMPPVQFPITIKVKVLVNGPVWASINQRLQEIKDWYTQNSGGKIDLQFITASSNFSSIPFLSDPMTYSAVVDEKWFDANVLDSSYDNTTLVIRDADLPDTFTDPQTGQKLKLLARTTGYLGKKPTKTVVACEENSMSEIWPSLNALYDYLRHELMHSCYIFSGYTIGNETFGTDYTHKYFYPPGALPGLVSVGNPEGAFSQLDYEHINQTLMKGEPMPKFFKVNDHGKLGIMILEGLTGIILFEDKMSEYLTLQQITSEKFAAVPTINIP